MSQLKIVERKITDLIPADYNPRELTAKQHKDLRRSLEEFGFVDPVIVNKHKTRKDIMVGGHQRTKVWSEMGHDTVPTVEVKLTLERERELNVRLNKNTGQWDWDQLANYFDTEELVEWGFDVKELQIRTKKETKEDDFDTTPKEDPKSKVGDLYQIAGHRIICGDSTDPKVWAKLMEEDQADVVFTDPPYNVNYSGRGENTSNTILNDKMDDSSFRDMLHKAFAGMVEYAKPGAAHYICHSSSSQRAFEDCMEAVGLKTKNQIIWNKTIASMGWGDYRWKHEPIFYATRKDVSGTFYGDRSQYTVWNEKWDVATAEKRLKAMSKKMEAGNSTVWTLGRDSNYEHPTQKPLQLIEHALNNSTKEGDIVLDPFGGSGSTLMAAHQMDRRARTIELDPRYADVIVRRLCRYLNEAGEAYTVIKNKKDITKEDWLHG